MTGRQTVTFTLAAFAALLLSLGALAKTGLSVGEAEAGGDDVITATSTSANRTATTATVTVSGFSLSVIPGWKVRITQSASVPVEQVTAP